MHLDDIVKADLVSLPLEYVRVSFAFLYVPALALGVPQLSIAQPIPSTCGVDTLAARISVDVARLVENHGSSEPSVGTQLGVPIGFLTVVKVVVVKIAVPADGSPVALPKLIDTPCHMKVFDLTSYTDQACL